MPLIVATNVCHAARLQRRTGSARTSLGPILNYDKKTIIVVKTNWAEQSHNQEFIEVFFNFFLGGSVVKFNLQISVEDLLSFWSNQMLVRTFLR
jgi:hypothetical protein